MLFRSSVSLAKTVRGDKIPRNITVRAKPINNDLRLNFFFIAFSEPFLVVYSSVGSINLFLISSSYCKPFSLSVASDKLSGFFAPLFTARFYFGFSYPAAFYHYYCSVFKAENQHTNQISVLISGFRYESYYFTRLKCAIFLFFAL